MLLFFQKPVNESPGDAYVAGNRGQVISTEPSGVFNFPVVKGDLATLIGGGKSNHEGVREWPGLAPKIAYLPDGKTYLLLHFPCYRCFQCFPRFYKAGNNETAFHLSDHKVGVAPEKPSRAVVTYLHPVPLRNRAGLPVGPDNVVP
jgi:hypothetical protein